MVKKHDIEYYYDYKEDIFDISIAEDYVYDSTIKLDEGVFLDFDKNNIPIALEILGASKVTKIDKENLKMADVQVIYVVTPEKINVEITFSYPIHNKPIDILIEKNIANEYNLPTNRTILATG
jgi:uncharacterized protein YuzE